jgi:hypothetical protein
MLRRLHCSVLESPAVQPWPQTPADHQLILEQMDRMLESYFFRKSSRYTALFRYVVQETLAGRGDELKERNLGTMLGRNPDYDTSTDPVVRITMGEIRKRIALYYREPGHDTEVQIDLPTYSYVPEFRLPAQPIMSTTSVVEIVGERRPRVRRVFIISSIGVAVVALLVAAWFSQRSRALNTFWGPLSESSGGILLCIGGGSSPAGLPVSEAAGHMVNGRVTFAEAVTVGRLAALLQAKAKPYRIEAGESLTLADFEDKPVVLIGHLDNPWAMRLTNQLRYTVEYSRENRQQWILDRQNPAKRNWTVEEAPSSLRPSQCYAVISRFWDPMSGQPVIVAAGIPQYGVIAAGELLTNPSVLESMAKQAPLGWAHKNLQIVIATNVIQGCSRPPHILATYFW